MIEPRELRIGNLIAYNGRPDQVIHLTNQHIETFVGPEEPLLADSDSWSPIPLTAEWLERFGIERVSDGVIADHWHYEGFFLYIDETDAGHKYYYMSDAALVTIDYVHQLQNLYFALTGTELDLKP